MFSHIMVGSNDLDASRKFYDAVLGAIGYPAGVTDEKGRIFYLSPTGVFAITAPIDGNPATVANGATIGFAVQDSAGVDAWHKAGVSNGGAFAGATLVRDRAAAVARRMTRFIDSGFHPG